MRIFNNYSTNIVVWTALLCLLSSLQVYGQSAIGSAGPSPILTINGGSYQGYCVEYTQGAGPSGHSYTFDTTPEDITNPNVTAAMRGQAQYGTSATQSAIWYFTDNVSVPLGSAAQNIVNRVLNGTYQPMCASEWVPSNYSAYQDIMTGDDPFCNSGGGPSCSAPNVSATSSNAGCSGTTALANGTVTINASGGSGGSYFYGLSGSDWTSSNVFTGLQAGTYTAFATTNPANPNCASSYTVTVGQTSCGSSCFPNIELINNGPLLLARRLRYLHLLRMPVVTVAIR